MDKKALKNENYITLDKFLRNYYLVDNEEIISLLTRLSHKNLKKVCKDFGIILSSVPFEAVTKSDLGCGDVILVSDNFNNLAPYKNPRIYEDNYGKLR